MKQISKHAHAQRNAKNGREQQGTMQRLEKNNNNNIEMEGNVDCTTYKSTANEILSDIPESVEMLAQPKNWEERNKLGGPFEIQLISVW